MLTLSPSSASFTAKIGAKSKARKITAANHGKVAITLMGAHVTGDFALSKVCGVSLKPKKKCIYSVQFAPTVKGARAGSLTINSNSSSGLRTVTLSGTGQ